MSDLLYFILFAAGLLMVVKGSDWFVGSTVWAAEVFRIPQIIIGATIVSICTTLPETFVSATAALKGISDMAVGNSLGSIGVNTGFILAFLLFWTQPLIENRKELLKNCFFLAFLLLFLWCLGFFFDEISRTMGFVLIILFFLYIINNVISARKLMDLDIRYDIVDEQDVFDHTDPYRPMPEGLAYDESENDFDLSLQMVIRKVFFFILGIVFVIFGSNLLVESGIGIAGILHVPDFLIAVLFTSVGTSLPELITVITSVKKGVFNLGIGNIIGADILNVIQVVGISALLHPLPVANERSVLTFQLPALLLMALSVAFLGIFCRKRLNKWGGVWLFVLYLVFLAVNIFRGDVPILGPLLFQK
jgi:K+-dependent Na+/Ca+ exchanger related-protein